ncbi:MAG: hypothetical protein BRC30_01995 [Nanohaloarchaea archaeon SW_7_46_7]|nr:MAG: hypothetical protein BRC30_01995 [Nanohaloarchaea archaeon SW_7_46_7]
MGEQTAEASEEGCKKDLDEFDRKAKTFIEEGKMSRLKDILREYTMCAAYETGQEIRNPSRFLKASEVDIENIQDFTEYRVAKSMLRSKIKQRKRGRLFKIFEGNFVSSFLM